jgi:hypothetical protein
MTRRGMLKDSLTNNVHLVYGLEQEGGRPSDPQDVDRS